MSRASWARRVCLVVLGCLDAILLAVAIVAVLLALYASSPSSEAEHGAAGRALLVAVVAGVLLAGGVWLLVRVLRFGGPPVAAESTPRPVPTLAQARATRGERLRKVIVVMAIFAAVLFLLFLIVLIVVAG